MADLDAALLNACLRFASGRLDEARASIATPQQLLALVSPGADPQQLAGQEQSIADDLTKLATAAAALGNGIADPPTDLSGVSALCTQLGAALTALSDAVATTVGIVGNPDQATGMQRVLVPPVMNSVAQFSGLAKQLGLAPTANNALQVGGTAITFTLVNGHMSFAGLLDLDNTRVTAMFNWSPPGTLSVTLETAIAADVVADAFVQQLVPGKPRAAAPLVVNVDSTRGITLGSGVKHRVSLPGKLDVLGVVELRDFAIELPDPSELGGGTAPAFAVTATIAGALGPIAAVVEGTGVELDLPSDAILAGSDNPVQLGPHAPTGAGLSVNAGVVRGGGYVEHKPPDEYGGVLDLAIGPIEVKAIGLITTDPFSLVLVLSVEFNPGIQLSFGFMLSGVGGLLAIDRTVSTDALRAGIHDHTLDNVLFPADPVRQAPHILNSLASSFPAAEGAFVVGPMLEISWGVGIPLVTAKVGVLIALPDPKVIIVGILRVAVPTPDAAIVDLRATLYGEITPDHILVLVSLEGSRVAGFALSGDFGLLIAYGDDPNFAITAGGFHPHYRPPAELVGMHRVAIDLSPPAVLTLRADAYFALTANSFQLGTHVHLSADLGVVSAEGHLGFDALVRWSPHFAFEIDLSVGIAVYVFGESFAGVELDLHLEGPAPWKAHGSGSVSFLFFDVSFDVGPITWGDAGNPSPDEVSPVQMVTEALGKKEAWHAVAPDQGDRVATMRSVDPPPDKVLVHPLGAFEVRQQVVPLETTIDHIGAHPVSENRVNLDAPMVGLQSARAVSQTTDRFAPAQFLALSDDEKLSRPAFEPMPSGMRLSGSAGDTRGTPVETPYQWDTVYPHEVFGDERHLVVFDPALLNLVLLAGPVGESAMRSSSVYAVEPKPIALADPGNVMIRTTRDLTPIAGFSADALTTTDAARVVSDAVRAGMIAGDSVQLVGLGVAR